MYLWFSSDDPEKSPDPNLTTGSAKTKGILLGRNPLLMTDGSSRLSIVWTPGPIIIDSWRLAASFYHTYDDPPP